ncbi:type VII secretion target [Amycolatopsis sp. NPDC051371]|uniref:type VII secretion target n=1 Tax=Amycolatopsis sp. NPDC051371 TaxID=3155800 RepID=UPI00343F4E35
MTGFHADPAALDALALRLDDTAEEYAAAAAQLESAASGELGPLSVSSALAALTGEWSGRIRAVETDFATAAGSVRAAAKAYRTTDAAAADELGRADG